MQSAIADLLVLNVRLDYSIGVVIIYLLNNEAEITHSTNNTYKQDNKATSVALIVYMNAQLPAPVLCQRIIGPLVGTALQKICQSKKTNQSSLIHTHTKTKGEILLYYAIKWGAKPISTSFVHIAAYKKPHRRVFSKSTKHNVCALSLSRWSVGGWESNGLPVQHYDTL